MTATMYQRLVAKNDNNGNPRRCFLLFNKDGKVVNVIDEGYAGLPVECRKLVQLPDMRITINEYKMWLRNA